MADKSRNLYVNTTPGDKKNPISSMAKYNGNYCWEKAVSGSGRGYETSEVNLDVNTTTYLRK